MYYYTCSVMTSLRVFGLLVVFTSVCPAQKLKHDDCTNRCFLANNYAHTCQCDSDCETIGNCCSDFWTRCRGTETGLAVTSKEINQFAQSLWDNDANRISSALYNLNYQGQTNSKDNVDEASAKLIVPVDSQLDSILTVSNSTYHTFMKLLNNYESNTHHPENRPAKEIHEENLFWDAISRTKVIQLTFDFLVHNGFIKGDMHALRTVFNELWFELNPHTANTAIGSDSGFEHVMVGETVLHHGQNRTAHSTVSGFNSWIHYYNEEKNNRTDYQGYYKHTEDPNIVEIRFNWRHAVAHARTFFVGTSPEFDLALYTVCALAYPNKDCPVTINHHRVIIRTTIAKHGHVEHVTSVALRFHASTPIVG